MASSREIDAAAFGDEARRTLESIRESQARLEDLPGVLDGTLDRFRERIDRLLRESEVDNWRQVRIFLRDVDGIAADLAKAAKDRALHPKHLHLLDLSLRKARKRDFFGARKVWRKLDKVAEQTAEVRRLLVKYRDSYRSVEASIRQMKSEAERLEKVPKPTASAADARTLISDVDDFNAAAQVAYLDYLSTAPASSSIPFLLGVTQGSGVGIPAPPRGADSEPLLSLLADQDPARESLRTKSFYGLLELPGYSDAKLTHIMGDARLVRRALDSAWAWLKAIREDERRSLAIQWSEDTTVLRQRLPALVTFLERIDSAGVAKGKGEALAARLVSGEFAALQEAARVYGQYGADAERRWRGELSDAIRDLRGSAGRLEEVVRRLPKPEAVEAGKA